MYQEIKVAHFVLGMLLFLVCFPTQSVGSHNLFLFRREPLSVPIQQEPLGNSTSLLAVTFASSSTDKRADFHKAVFLKPGFHVNC